jgi:hypothetical protein
MFTDTGLIPEKMGVEKVKPPISRGILVEARGIEPLSEDLWHKAATCLARELILKNTISPRTGFLCPIPFV